MGDVEFDGAHRDTELDGQSWEQLRGQRQHSVDDEREPERIDGACVDVLAQLFVREWGSGTCGGVHGWRRNLDQHLFGERDRDGLEPGACGSECVFGIDDRVAVPVEFGRECEFGRMVCGRHRDCGGDEGGGLPVLRRYGERSGCLVLQHALGPDECADSQWGLLLGGQPWELREQHQQVPLVDRRSEFCDDAYIAFLGAVQFPGELRLRVC